MQLWRSEYSDYAKQIANIHIFCSCLMFSVRSAFSEAEFSFYGQGSIRALRMFVLVFRGRSVLDRFCLYLHNLPYCVRQPSVNARCIRAAVGNRFN